MRRPASGSKSCSPTPCSASAPAFTRISAARGVVWFRAMATDSTATTGAALALARERPEMGVVRAARELRKRGVRLSPSGVREIWARHGLRTSYQRLLSRKRVNGDHAALSEAQRALLQRIRVSRRLQGDASGRR